MFVTNETTSPDLGSPIVSVSTVNSHFRPYDIEDQMERFSETSSIELIIQGSYEPTQQQEPTVRVPESHTMNFNHYPGAKNSGQVPIDIVKSFAPVVAQNDHSQREESDIYSDYVQDPYNLTLQIENGNVNEELGNETNPSTSTFFQSSSYFSNDSNVLKSPGSELFNRP